MEQMRFVLVCFHVICVLKELNQIRLVHICLCRHLPNFQSPIQTSNTLSYKHFKLLVSAKEQPEWLFGKQQ